MNLTDFMTINEIREGKGLRPIEDICGSGGAGGSTSGIAVPMYSTSSSYGFVISAVTPWRCEYCGSLNEGEKLACEHCGAPRGNK